MEQMNKLLNQAKREAQESFKTTGAACPSLDLDKHFQHVLCNDIMNILFS
jgi:hypothetical protein